ncbi:PREDICTED: uncharacterized protein LOC104591249 [Nelumbo nucifera]|uniref:BSD domain-containing protein n=2 Tax=Nelumbo nucifera TaxID=4432 RepID=A0A822ZXF8_NELNU|nr:PREDICTED: uncharacterized protein LOC104591249 [Nelumbo nucifera]DAD48221.1 TPA_asm: hypothetical protein HUJ06_018158 [Nelumbo nucifera]
MSWLTRSLVNSLKVYDDDDDDEDDGKERINDRKRDSPEDEQLQQQHHIDSFSEDHGRGLKEDLSEFKKTLARQLWGVASFLSPPPPSTSQSPSPSPPPPPLPPISSTDPTISDWNRWESSDQSVSGETFHPEIPDSAGIAGIRSDFAEIGGKFKSGFSKLSGTRAVSEISKIASTFLPPFGIEGESVDNTSVEGVIGVTDEVLAFAKNIAMHPETWLDFPLHDEEDLDDFEMSDTQQEHALAVERLAPRLAALRIELCPGYISEGFFWKVYFVLLHSRLNKHDAELLSTPQIVEARTMWMQELQNSTKPEEPDWPKRGMSYECEGTNLVHEGCLSASCNSLYESVSLKTFASEYTSVPVTDFETEKHPVVSSEMQIIDKSVVEEGPAVNSKDKADFLLGSSSKDLDQKFEDDGDEWLEDNSDLGGFSGTTIPLGDEEDVSFSDLEEDDDGNIPVKSKTVAYISETSTKDSRYRSSTEPSQNCQFPDKEHI